MDLVNFSNFSYQNHTYNWNISYKMWCKYSLYWVNVKDVKGCGFSSIFLYLIVSKAATIPPPLSNKVARIYTIYLSRWLCIPGWYLNIKWILSRILIVLLNFLVKSGEVASRHQRMNWLNLIETLFINKTEGS